MSYEQNRKCVKCGCSPSRDGVTLFRFPNPGVTNIIRCTIWAKFILPDGEYLYTTVQKKLFSEHRMLCNRHFRDSDFTDITKKKLLRTAVPVEIQEQHIEEVPATIPQSGPSSECFEKPQPGPSHQHLQESFSAITKDISSGVTDSQKLTPLKDLSNVTKISVSKPHSEKQIASEKEKKLQEKCCKYMKKISYLRNRITKLTNKEILNILENDINVKKLSKIITPTLALLLQGQIRNVGRKKTARRWSKEEKITALRIFKRSPTCYRLLRRLFCLPSPGTLKSMLNKVSFGVGINKALFKVLKKYVSTQKRNENLYVLLFDEMSIRKHYEYNTKDDVIQGFQDHGSQGRSSEVASYALVFMIAGVKQKVKQPIAHYFSSGSSTADRLAVLIKEVLNECFNAGINIVATVCDMDGVNRRAYSILGATVDQPYFVLNNKEIITIYDTPHLIKSFRNLFLKYDIKCPTDISSGTTIGTGVAKWSHIKEFFEMDNTNPNFVYAPALTKDHLNPNSKQKMKVSMACQVLSSSVAGGMYAKISGGELPLEATVTANVVQEMDKLFDALNSDSVDLRRGKMFATNMSSNTQHLNLFLKMKLFFKQMKYVGIPRTPPSQEGWIWTLTAMERLWKDLEKKKKIKHLATRRIQQDPLENLFGCIGGNCGSNTNPTCGQFVAALKTAVLSKLAHMSMGNCEDDDNEVISNFDILLSVPHPKRICLETETIATEELQYNIEGDLENDSPEIQACAYVCGFMLKKMGKDLCENCKQSLYSTTIESHHMFVECKEYNELKKSLKYASKEMVLCVESCASIINIFLKEKGYFKNLIANVKSILKDKINFDFIKCESHRENIKNRIIHDVFFICVKRFCTVQNRYFSQETSAASLKRKMNIILHK